MTNTGPGRCDREGMTLFDLHRMFPDDETAERFFVESRWPDGPECPHCDSNNIQIVKTRKPTPYRCRSCRKHFSVRTGSLMESSKLGFQTWAFAMYLLTTSLKGQSSMNLHRDLGVTQKTAWFLAHRIRETFDDENQLFSGPVEVDETYMGGKRKNMSLAKRKELRDTGAGRGAVGKTDVVGAKDRATKRVKAQVVQSTDAETLQGFVADLAEPGATIYTDEATAYAELPFPNETVKHSVAENVREQAHINGMESFWSMLKRAHTGIYHKMSPKHLPRYVREFAGRHNVRGQDTIEQMTTMVERMREKRLRHSDLIG